MNPTVSVLKSQGRGTPADAMSLALVHEHNTRVEADALLMAEKQLVVQLQRSLADLKKESSGFQRAAADAEAKCQVHQAECASLRQENVSLRDRLSVPVNKDLSESRAECAGLKAELVAAKEKLAALEAEYAECEEESEEYEKDLEEAKLKCADLAARLESERTERTRSMEMFKTIVAGLKKEERVESGVKDFEIDVVRGGDNLTRKLKVKLG